ncbi:MAG: hypothetical protein K0S86_5249, partial [Geminicoccaceae bacterium]|nr:hypothetical protein [Geminicoccaceae bacterium]
MLRRPRSLTLVLVALLAVPVYAQTSAHGPHANSAPTLLESYAKAVRLIDSAVAAHGGVEALRRGRRVRVISDGWDFHRTQGSRVAPPYDSTVARSDAMIDLSRGRIVRRRVRGWPGGFHYTDWYVSDSARHFYIEPRNRRYS